MLHSSQKMVASLCKLGQASLSLQIVLELLACLPFFEDVVVVVVVVVFVIAPECS